MATIVNDVDARLAARLKVEREGREWSVGELSQRSGVSKAMIGKIERGESSPTASLLGRLSGAFGLTLSTLLARVENASGRVARAADQSIWQDPETGFHRTAISPPGSKVLELVRGVLPPGAEIAYPASAYAFLHQQIWVLNGTLTFKEGSVTHVLRAGDCLELGPPSDCVFENRGKRACEYLVAIVRRS